MASCDSPWSGRSTTWSGSFTCQAVRGQGSSAHRQEPAHGLDQSGVGENALGLTRVPLILGIRGSRGVKTFNLELACKALGASSGDVRGRTRGRMGGRTRAVDPTQVSTKRDQEGSRQGNLPDHQRHRRRRGMVQTDAGHSKYADGDGNSCEHL